ncbi:MAG: gamma-glutamylcyclotransferase [Deltaproteobacteria bacterium]|nr:gamma-glutamylcyclotransferase [Deltaproteobacteria bacterium]
MREPELLFVYGTLRKGFGHSLHRTIESHARFLGLARFKGVLYDLGPYPAVVPAPASGSPDADARGVLGEVYALNHPGPLLKALDLYEGCVEPRRPAAEYRRERVSITLEDGTPAQAWIYLYNHSPLEARQIPEGDYLADRHRVRAAPGRGTFRDDSVS